MVVIQIEGTPSAAAAPVKVARTRRRVVGKRVPKQEAGSGYMGDPGEFGTTPANRRDFNALMIGPGGRQRNFP